MTILTPADAARILAVSEDTVAGMLRAGVRLPTVDAWRRRHADFPAPEWHVSGTPVWRWEAVAAWLEKPRPNGRPRK